MYNSLLVGHKRLLVFPIFCILIFLSVDSFAQQVSVNYATGSPSLSMPIYSVNYGHVSVPVFLQYSGDAIKVEDGGSNAGLGWNLPCANYGVFRQVRGLPDETPVNGWLVSGFASTISTYSVTSDDATSTTIDETADFNFINSFGYNVDSEPDLYTVSAPGLNVQFVYDQTGAPVLLTYQDITITPITATGGFTIKNNLGVTWTFNVQEQVTRKATLYKTLTSTPMFQTDYLHYSTPVSFIQAWYLSNITDEAGFAVNLSYVGSGTSQSTSFTTRITTTINSPDTLYATTDTYLQQTLYQITGGNITVSFSWTWDVPSLINYITVTESGTGDSFAHSFTYQQAYSSTNTGPPNYHSFLSSINRTSTCTPGGSWRFGYQGVTMTGSPYYNAGPPSSVEMPWTTNYSQDMWGYYNGYTADHDVPQLYYYSGQTDSRRFSFQTIGAATPTTLTGTARNTNAAKMSIGSLIRVTYPTGGYTTILWERNKYLDTVTGQVLFGPGQRVASLITDAGEANYGRNATTSNKYHQIRADYSYNTSETDTTTSSSLNKYVSSQLSHSFASPNSFPNISMTAPQFTQIKWVVIQ